MSHVNLYDLSLLHLNVPKTGSGLPRPRSVSLTLHRLPPRHPILHNTLGKETAMAMVVVMTAATVLAMAMGIAMAMESVHPSPACPFALLA